MKIILGSTSPYRRKLLEQLHLSFEVHAPQVDEELLKKTSPVSLPDLPRYLAEKKAESLVSLYPKDLVIGCDQMGLFAGQALNKAGSREKAVGQLLKLQGQTHQLITALVVMGQGRKETHVDITELTMRPLTEAQIRHYVDLDNPTDCAGSYKVEALGVSLFEGVKTQDPSAIVGLPLMALVRLLKTFSVDVL